MISANERSELTPMRRRTSRDSSPVICDDGQRPFHLGMRFVKPALRSTAPGSINATQRRMPSDVGSSLMNRGLALFETPIVPRPTATGLATRAKPAATPHRTTSETAFRCSDSTPGGRNKNGRKSAKRRGFSVSVWSSNKPSRRRIEADEASLYKLRGEIPTVASDLGLIVDHRADN